MSFFVKQIQLIFLFAYPSTDVARNEKQSNIMSHLCWMDAWHCLKAGTGPGGLGLGVKVSGQQVSSPSPKGDTVTGTLAMKAGHSLALPRAGIFSTRKSQSNVTS